MSTLLTFHSQRLTINLIRVTEMKTKTVYANLSFTLCIFYFAESIAVPIAQWEEPWQVECLVAGQAQAQPCPVGPPNQGFGLNKADFGPKGTAGQKLPDTDAIAKAESRAQTNEAASSQVEFRRKFSLSGSPDGWNVVLEGSLTGKLETTGMPTVARVRASAFIIPMTLEVTFPELPDFFLEARDGQVKAIDLFDADGALLMDGMYNVVGALNTSAIVGTDPTGAAVSDFFSTFSVRTIATPVSEPSTFALLCFTLATIGFRRGLDRRKKGPVSINGCAPPIQEQNGVTCFSI